MTYLLRSIRLSSLLVFSLLLPSCYSNQAQPSEVLSVAGRASLRFGPEFEFIKKPELPPFFPARRYAFTHAVRKFSPHLELTSEADFPEIWVPTKTSVSAIHFDDPLSYKGDLLFNSSPDRWPTNVEGVSINTGGLGGSQYDNITNPPHINFYFADDGVLELTYAVDDVTLEAHINPLTTKQAQAYEPIISDIFFDATIKGGMEVPSFGGGHIHIDIGTILNRADPDNFRVGLRLLRDFMVDFYEQSYFSAFLLRADPKWAQTLGMTSYEDVLNFNDKIKQLDMKIDSAHIKNIKDAKKFVRQQFGIFNELIPHNLLFSEITERLSIPPETALAKPAIIFSAEHDTIEIRAFRAQQSFNEYLNLTRMLTARFDYLADRKGTKNFLSWDEIRLDEISFYDRKLSPELVEKLAKQSEAYLSDVMSYLPPAEKPQFSQFARDFFAPKLSKLVCP